MPFTLTDLIEVSSCNDLTPICGTPDEALDTRGICEACCDFSVTCPNDTDLGSFNCNNLENIPACPSDVAALSLPPYNITIGQMPCGMIAFTCSDDAMPDGCTPVNQVITRTITVFDDLNNNNTLDASEESQVCTFNITINPPPAVLITCPANATIECDEDTSPANTGNAIGMGGCGIVVVTFSDVSTQGAAGCAQYMYMICLLYTSPSPRD